ncbi:MAG: ribosomal protein S18-alanine N-acetyltransferase [Pseudomonadota bacterium]
MTAQAFTILKPADAADLARLHASAFEAPWSEDSLRQTLSQATSFGLGLVSETDDMLVGFALTQHIGDTAELLALAIKPDFQRGGLASRLLAATAEHLRARGCVTMILEVAEDNSGARSLYQARGFLEDGRRPKYYPREGTSAVDAILMRATLTGLSGARGSLTAHGSA